MSKVKHYIDLVLAMNDRWAQPCYTSTPAAPADIIHLFVHITDSLCMHFIAPLSFSQTRKTTSQHHDNDA